MALHVRERNGTVIMRPARGEMAPVTCVSGAGSCGIGALLADAPIPFQHTVTNAENTPQFAYVLRLLTLSA